MVTGDRGREAYTAIAWGVGLSHERLDIAGAESLYSLEGNMCGTAMRGAEALPGSKATSRAKRPIGTWEVSGLAAACSPQLRRICDGLPSSSRAPPLATACPA